MLIKTQEGEKRVAGPGTTALGIIGTTLGGIAVAKEASEGGGFFNFFGRGRGRGGCGEDFDGGCCDRRARWEYGDEIAFLKSELCTNKKVECLEEKVECMLKPIYAQLKCLEINAAVDNAVEAQRNKDYAIIDKLKYYIDQLEDDKYVKKSYYHPIGQVLGNIPVDVDVRCKEKRECEGRRERECEGRRERDRDID